MIRVQINVVGQQPRSEVTWPAGWPVPRVDDEVMVDDDILFVRTVCWYPQGDLEALAREPFVYVVVGLRRV